MSHSSINDKLRQLASDIQDGVDNSELVKAIAMPNEQRSDELGFVTRCIMVGPKHTGADTSKPGGDYSVTKHTGWIVLHRMTRMDCTTFIAPAIFGTKQDADSYASVFDNIVAIVPIEWEEVDMAARTNTGKNAEYSTSVSSHEPIRSKARNNWFTLGSWSVVLIIGLAFWAGVISLFM